MSVLRDRKLDFSESKEAEWKIVLEKVADGVELPDPDTERWFTARVEGSGIRITGAEKNVRALKIYEPPLIELEEFAKVASIYNDLLFPEISMMSDKLELQQTSPNLKYIFNLIYNFL